MLTLALAIHSISLTSVSADIVTLDSLHFQDSQGECRLLVRSRETETLGEAGYRSEIWAGQYSGPKDNLKVHWKLYDLNTNALESIEYQKGSYRIVDINQDSSQDLFLWYWKLSDGMDPDTLKLFLYVSGSKYAIRGTIPKTGEDLDSYAKRPDKSLKSAPSWIRIALDQQWQDIVDPRLDSLKSENVLE